ncbi:MAG: DNA alkylation repair protein [Anaerolineales bacterium]|nr:DNA alkylation repair protein [Anaerolineales bacterium]
MPAINPTRLKHETAELAAYFADPARFLYELDKLLDRYADRVRRPGQTGAPAPLLPAFKVAPPVMRQIMLTLTPLAQANPLAALTLADTLWEKPILEIRQIALRLLSLAPAHDPTPFLTRAHAWAIPKEEEHILEELFRIGLAPLQNHHPQQFLELVREWMGHTSVELQILGAKALFPLAQNPTFDNLPQIYRILLPRMIDAPSVLRGHLAIVIHALATRSPRETAHFLNQVLIVSDNPGIAWITRQVLDLFPEETQERLRETIRNR